MADRATQGTDAATLVMLDEIDSTNAEALRRVAAGARGPMWICARRQTQGRGRSGRSWASPPGTLSATLMLTPDCPPSALPQLGLVAGVGVVDAIRATAGEATSQDAAVRLKWPNDVLLDGAKVAGILVESGNWGSDLVAMIGIGINVETAPQVAGRQVASLAGHGIATTPEKMAEALRAALAHWLALWQRGQAFAGVRAAWIERAGPTGETITVNTGAGPVSGRYAGIDNDGALLVDDGAGGRQRYTFGDVTLMRQGA